MAVTLRQLGPHDNLDEAVRLFDAYRQFYKLPADASAARMYLTMRLQAGQSVVYLAEEAGRAVGFMQLYATFCSLALAPIWILNDLYTVPEARGKGVANALLEEAKRHGRAHGAAYLTLATAHSNAAAQRVYEANGWQLDTEFRYYTFALDEAA